MAASFMGCTRATSFAEPSPVAIVPTMPIKPTQPASLMLLSDASILRFFMSIQQLTPITNTPETVQPHITAWKNLFTATGENANAQKSAITLRICAGSNSMPTGYCIHAFATRIHHADSDEPMAVSHVAVRWKRLLTFFQPKNITAMNVDSMKNASKPSMASGAPKMSPTNQL